MTSDGKPLIDYHVHPYYSLDAEGTVDEYCRKALSLGLTEVGFTPHLELDLHRSALDDKVRLGDSVVPMRSDWIRIFAQDVERAREKYPLELRVGIEVGYDEEIEGELKELLKRYPFDFCLGAIHCLDHVAITDRREYELYYRKRSVREVLSSYFTELDKAIRSQLFDAIAHIDVYKKYGMGYYGEEILELEREFIFDALALMVRHDVALEVNTAGLRRVGDFYPPESILKSGAEMGVEKVIIGSDCHEVEQLARGVEQAVGLVRSVGFTLCGFKNRQVYEIDYGVE